MGWKEALQIAIFILAWIPVGFLAGATVFEVDPVYEHDFSIYNTEWNGLSQFRTQIETNGFTPLAIQASMSVITRYNGSAVLMIIGPVPDFTIDATLTIFQHLTAGGSVVIADDFGTANRSFSILNDFLLGSGGNQAALEALNVSGYLSFVDGVLIDLDSYDKSPKLPVIRNFPIPHPLTTGVSELHLNNATAISPYCAVGLAPLAVTTTRAWCETNISDPEPSPNEYELAGALPVIGALDLGALNGEGGKIVAISDPSIFINDMVDRFDGNRRLSENLINWLTDGDTDIPIMFCEQLLATPILSGEFFFGAYLSRVLWATTNIFLAPLYPLMTAVGIKKYLPEMKKPEVKSVSEVFLRRGQTYFGERMTYYRTEGNYARVVKMLYRRLRRGLRKKHQWAQYEPKKLWDILRYKDPKLKESEFHKIIQRIEEISSRPGTKLKEGEMMNLFFFMRNIQDKLIETK